MRIALVAALALAVVGCGGATLNDDEDSKVAAARVAISQAVVESFGEHECESTLPPELCDERQSVEDLIAIYRDKPDAEYDPDEEKEGDELTMRQVLEDSASDLDEVDADLAAQIDRALNRP